MPHGVWWSALSSACPVIRRPSTSSSSRPTAWRKGPTLPRSGSAASCPSCASAIVFPPSLWTIFWYFWSESYQTSRGGVMLVGYHAGYGGAGPAAGAAEPVADAERLGVDSVWTAEAYGSDALTPLAWW